MYRTKEDMIVEIMKRPVSEILINLLGLLELYQLDSILKNLAPSWRDKVTYEFLCSLNLLKFIKSVTKWYAGGNWSLDGYADVKQYKCNVCGCDPDVEGIGYAHLTRCDGIKKLMNKCSSFEEFCREIKKYQNE